MIHRKTTHTGNIFKSSYEYMEGKNKANCESIRKRQYVDISEKKKKKTTSFTSYWQPCWWIQHVTNYAFAMTLINNLISRKHLFSLYLKENYWVKCTFQKFRKICAKNIFFNGFLYLLSTQPIAPMKNATPPIHLPRHFFNKMYLSPPLHFTFPRIENLSNSHFSGGISRVLTL